VTLPELSDAQYLCAQKVSTKFFTMVTGFDALVNIKIVDSEQISQIISIRTNLELNSNYSVELHKSKVTNRLIKLGYDLEFGDEDMDQSDHLPTSKSKFLPEIFS
jgi:hypothetical protein